MTAAEVLDQARATGVTLWVEGDALRYRGPREALTADLLDSLKVHKTALLEALAARVPVNLEGALAAACEGVAGISREVFRSLLSPEDVADIEAGDIPVETLRAYALSFAKGPIRSGQIGAPVHARKDAKPDPASGSIVITDAELEAARKGRTVVKQGDWP